jgi:hypothetical protein
VNAFTGTIEYVRIDLGGDAHEVPAADELRAVLQTH